MSLIPFAYSKDKEQLVDVHEVPRGLKCNCVCPSCGMRLEARQGEINIHHFSHHDKAKIECAYSFWVSIRDMAKQILKELKYLYLPNIEVFSNLHAPPYKNCNSIIQILEVKKGREGFDLILNTSSGSMSIFFITNEIGRNMTDQRSSYFTNTLILEIDLRSLGSRHRVIKKDNLRSLIQDNNFYKRIVQPIESFLCKDTAQENQLSSYSESDYYEMKRQKIDEIAKTSLETAGDDTPVNRHDSYEVIMRKLYLDPRGVTIKQKNTIKKMGEFYFSCINTYTTPSNEYLVLYEHDEFKYISYKGHFFAFANVDEIFIYYLFEDGNFIKISGSRNFESAYMKFLQYEVH